MDREQTELSREAKNAILRSRRLDLAKRREAEHSQEESPIEIVEFLLDGESYAMELQFLMETRSLLNVTHIPLAPNATKGIIYVRGHVVPVIDLLNLLGKKQSNTPHVFNKAIILKDEEQLLGIMVDEVLGVIEALQSQFQSAILGSSPQFQFYCKGVTKDRLHLLDSRKIISSHLNRV